MFYHDASEGLKKIRTAVIFELVATIFAIITGVIAIFAAMQLQETGANTLPAEAISPLAIVTLVASLAVMIFSLISFFMELSGLKMAANDDSNFQTARTLIFAAIITSVIAGVLQSFQGGGSTFSELSNIISNAVSMFVVYFVCKGASNLLNNIGHTVLARKGNTAATIIIVARLISTIAEAAVTFLGNNETVDMICAFILVGAGIAEIAGIFIYIRFLSDSSNALA
ncbi:MAG: hypothetical protein Q4C20_12715 [Erysipelotrichaceae bacterium]|nr:hypothetical protein [Erysipelotrichaceae bacterium]MDO4415928.1 hypothetical protein [Erysipelotrichaceae bacterium]